MNRKKTKVIKCKKKVKKSEKRCYKEIWGCKNLKNGTVGHFSDFYSINFIIHKDVVWLYVRFQAKLMRWWWYHKQCITVWHSLQAELFKFGHNAKHPALSRDGARVWGSELSASSPCSSPLVVPPIWGDGIK